MKHCLLHLAIIQTAIRIVLLFFVAQGVDCLAQPGIQPFQHDLRIQTERTLLITARPYHSVWPLNCVPGHDSLSRIEVQSPFPKSSRTFINRKVFQESFIKIDKPDFILRIDPLANFSAGREGTANRTVWTNTRGVRAEGSIGKNVAFTTSFYENQAVFASWIDSITRRTHVVPGQAYIKTFKQNGFDFGFAEGQVSYAPSKYFTFRFGHGKNFIGDGYRSMLLSDVSFNYPYLMATTKIWKIQYINLWAQMLDLKQLSQTPYSTWIKKYSTTHYLSWNVTGWMNIGLFESIVWQAVDDAGNQRGFDVNYLNPVIFYRPVEFSLKSPDNALLGGTLRFTVLKKNSIYSQLLLDEFKLDHIKNQDGWWANKYAIQAGFKSFDPFGIKNLFLQAEMNLVRPYTYSHYSSAQNYGHYNQPLAHPQGANFREALAILQYRYGRWLFDYKIVNCVYGADTAGLNFGKNIFLPYSTYYREFNNEIAQGLKTMLIQHDLKVSWIVNPATNLQLCAGLTRRSEDSDKFFKESTVIWAGLRTNLFNRYYDW